MMHTLWKQEASYFALSPVGWYRFLDSNIDSVDRSCLCSPCRAPYTTMMLYSMAK